MPYPSSSRSAVARLIRAVFQPRADSRDRYEWSEYDLRLRRYEYLQAFVDNQQYRGPIGTDVRANLGAYDHCRPAENPVPRIVDFHETYLWGGGLDSDAGPGILPDGTGVPTALPIVAAKTASQEKLSRAVASLWKASNWAARKGVVTRWGAGLGDAAIEAIADQDRGLIRLRPVHPGELEAVTLDPYGNVRGYTLCRWEVDPADPDGRRLARYREVVQNDDGIVYHRTYKDDAPYDWPGTPGREWRARWSFVPLVVIKHIDRGGAWGVSEIAHALDKTVERDSQASALGDQVLKATDVTWFARGIPIQTAAQIKAGEKPRLTFTTGTVPLGRVESKILSVNSEKAALDPMVFPLAIAEALEHGRSIGSSLERDYPELLADPVGLAASGEARREAKRKAADKIVARRMSYDPPLVSIHRMSMSMGALLDFPDFDFPEAAFRDKLLDHSIGPRPVFADDPQEVQEQQKAKAEEERIRAATVAEYVGAGVPLRVALVRAGWGEAELVAFDAALAADLADQDRQREDAVPEDEDVIGIAAA